jgi:hypothetical protein
MRSRAFVFVSLVLVAVPLLAEAAPARRPRDRAARKDRRHHGEATPAQPRRQPDSPLDKMEQPQPF